MMKEFYAIYHKRTGRYMPARMFEYSRGSWTWWEPTGIGGYEGHDPDIPRLFLKKNAAVQAMEYWLAESPEIPRNPNDVEIHVITLIVKAVI